MKKLLFLAGISLLSFQTLYAYSPLEQSVSEIIDIISNPQLRRFLPPQESIQDIRRVSNGYLLTTDHFQVFVEIRYRLKAGAEPRVDEKKSYDIKFSTPTQTK